MSVCLRKGESEIVFESVFERMLLRKIIDVRVGVCEKKSVCEYMSKRKKMSERDIETETGCMHLNERIDE